MLWYFKYVIKIIHFYVCAIFYIHHLYNYNTNINVSMRRNHCRWVGVLAIILEDCRAYSVISDNKSTGGKALFFSRLLYLRPAILLTEAVATSHGWNPPMWLFSISKVGASVIANNRAFFCSGKQSGESAVVCRRKILYVHNHIP